jgi:hypothetical protein
MNAPLKTLLNVSGIAKRNGRLPLVRAGKVCVNTLVSRQVYPLNHLLQPFDIRIPCQKIVRRLCRYTFSLSQQPASMMVP